MEADGAVHEGLGAKVAQREGVAREGEVVHAFCAGSRRGSVRQSEGAQERERTDGLSERWYAA